MVKSMEHILDYQVEPLKAWLKERGFPRYRATQIRDWIFQNRAEEFDQMKNLPQDLQKVLAENFHLWSSKTVKHTTADDGTEKLLLEYPGGGQIESVLLRDGVRRTICISTQVGCAMGCVFCASGLDGVDRNLTCGEIVEQMLKLQALLPEKERLSHIVVMGMGEPLANLDQLLPALQFATDPKGLGISPRRITISTVGLPKAMRKLAEQDVRYQLAVSLHAPNDQLRDQIVPVNDKIGIEEILKAADAYAANLKRRITYEYVLLDQVNDQPEHAQELARLLRDRSIMVNLIPYNPVAGLSYKTPSTKAQQTFRAILEQQGILFKTRHRKGDKINAACGQLRKNQEQLFDLT